MVAKRDAGCSSECLEREKVKLKVGKVKESRSLLGIVRLTPTIEIIENSGVAKKRQMI